MTILVQPRLLLLVTVLLHLVFADKSCSTYKGPTSVKPVPTYTTAFTVTTTETEFITTVYKTKSKGTATVLTSPGFTPVVSETCTPPPGLSNAQSSGCQRPTNNAALAAAATSYPQSVICTTTTTKTKTQTITNPHKVAATTTTVTSTVQVPAATYYAACGPDNVVNHGLGADSNKGIVDFLTFGSAPYTNQYLGIQTPYDCCVACQTTDGCKLSILSTFYGSNPPTDPACNLWFDNSSPCDGSYSPGPFEFYTDANNPRTPDQSLEYVSNGPCGEILYGGDINAK